MQTRTRVALAATLLALLPLSPLALAQEAENNDPRDDGEMRSMGDGSMMEQGHEGALPLGEGDGEEFAHAGSAWMAPCGLGGEGGDGNAAAQVADTSADVAVDTTQARTTDVDEDTVFAALAIHAVNDQPVSYGDLADVDASTRMRHTVRSTSGFDEQDVFSALALGITADDATGLDALACVSTLSLDATLAQDVSQRVDLDPDQALLAIALYGAGGELDWREVADVSRGESVRQSVDRSVAVGEDDTFLALALGIGGRAGSD